MGWRGWGIAVALAIGACGDDEGAGTDVSQDASVDPITEQADARVVDAARDARVPDAGDARVQGLPEGGADASQPDAARPDAGTARPSWVIAPGDKVFFVGNSFFDTGDRRLSEWVEAIGRAVTPTFPIETGDHNVPGVQPLTWFFEQQESQDAIASGEWDVFILQGADEEPVFDKAGFFDGVRAYHDAITAKGGKVMLFMTWDWKWSGGPDSETFQKISTAYDQIGEELNIPVIPVGVIYNDTEKDPFPGRDPWFLTDGDLHQNAAGSAVNAYATFSMLTGIDAMGIDFDARNNDNTPEMLRYCSEKSWARVVERLQD